MEKKIPNFFELFVFFAEKPKLISKFASTQKIPIFLLKNWICNDDSSAAKKRPYTFFAQKP